MTLEGEPVTLSALRGQVVFVNFWATWCPRCREEMPSIDGLHHELKDQELVILGVDMNESPTRLATLMKGVRLTVPVLPDAGSHVLSAMELRAFRAAVLARHGRVVGGVVGPRKCSLLEQPMTASR